MILCLVVIVMNDQVIIGMLCFIIALLLILLFDKML